MSNLMPVRQLLTRNHQRLSPKTFSCFESTSTASPKTQQNARLNKIIGRLPRSLQPYTARLRDAPVSHIVAFLILHEITAVVPLVGLAELFHFTGWIPKEVAEGKYMNEGVVKFGAYFRKKGWFGFGDESQGLDGDIVATDEVEQAHDVISEKNGAGTTGLLGAGKKQFLVEVAAAYAVTKVLLPVRVIVSVWATPWFARVFVSRMNHRFGKVFRRGGGKVVAAESTATNGTAKGAVGHGTGNNP